MAREDVDRQSGHCDNDGNELASSVAQWFSRFNDIEARAKVSRHRDDIYSSEASRGELTAAHLADPTAHSTKAPHASTRSDVSGIEFSRRN